MNYKYISEQRELEAIIPELMSSPIWGLDTETTGLDPHKDKIILMQIGTSQKQFVLDMRKLSVEPLKPFLISEDIKKVGHNLKFDYKMIKGNYGIDLECVRDTYLAEKLLHMGKKFGGFGLDDVVKSYLKFDLPKEERSSFGLGYVPEGDFTTAQLEYAARDVEYLIPLTKKQSDQLCEDELMHCYTLECNVLPCFADMEFDGMPLDVVGWKKLIDYNTEKAAEIEEQLNEHASSVVQGDLFGKVHVNWKSPDQVLSVLRSMNVKVSRWDRELREEVVELIDKTDDKTLKKIKTHFIVNLLKKYRSHSIRVTTFGEPYIQAISPVTGRLHPDIDQIGTETGRPANHSRKGSVNVLNIPRDKEYRNCFLAGENEVVETDDYSGCELRIWAEISGDPKLKEAFQRGEDVHCYVASKLFDKKVTKKDPERTPGKTLNFGGRI